MFFYNEKSIGLNIWKCQKMLLLLLYNNNQMYVLYRLILLFIHIRGPRNQYELYFFVKTLAARVFVRAARNICTCWLLGPCSHISIPNLIIMILSWVLLRQENRHLNYNLTRRIKQRVSYPQRRAAARRSNI